MIVASSNSPDRYKQQADIVCDADATKGIRQACNESGGRVKFAPGKYTLTQTIKHHCSLQGIGDVAIVWRSEKPGWMFDYQSEVGRFAAPMICNLALNGKGIASGMSLNRFQRGTLSDCRFYRCDNAVRTADAWFGRYVNLYILDCTGSAFYAFGPTGLISDLVISKCRNDNRPLVSITKGNLTIQSVTIEDCDSGDGPMMLLTDCLTMRVDRLDTERLACSEIVRVQDSRGILLERFEHAQRADKPGYIAVRVISSQDVRVGPFTATNFTEAYVQFEGCAGARDTWGISRRFPGQGVIPKHIVRDIP